MKSSTYFFLFFACVESARCIFVIKARPEETTSPIAFFREIERSTLLEDEDGGRKEGRGRLGRGTHGGFPCGACTVLVGIGEQLADINNETLAQGLARLCGHLPSPLSVDCSNLVFTLGPYVIDYITNSSTPDTLCYSVGLCVPEPGACHLFPKVDADKLLHNNKMSKPKLELVTELAERAFPWLCYIPGVRQICEALERTFYDLVPGLDFDDDGFSPAETFRGALWRGRDCHDGDGNIHPGRFPRDGDHLVDSNCNGIHGTNSATGLSWEEELCTGTGMKGIIYLGDSVGAHFHVPPQWLSPLHMDQYIFANLTEVITNEADWPQLGFATGFRNSTMPQLIHGSVDSIYLRMRERNLCNHRNYQNLARNGANSTDTLFYIKALTQKPRDYPALVFYSLIGNDVCTERPDPTLMTTPKEFKDNVMRTLNVLEGQLAPGSHVVLLGLIDASFLYDAMAERYHPLGLLNKNVKYKDMYRWFNCMEIGPCAGWMNANNTLREITSQRSRDLSKELDEIARSAQFFNFDITYIENPFQKVIEDWVNQGGQIHELVEPVDSLHPTQAVQPLIARQVWQELEKKAPHVLGPVNPNNQKIRQLFGNQGGH